MFRHFSFAIAISFCSTANAETPKKALVLVDQTIEKPELMVSNEGLTFSLQVGDNCKTRMGKASIPVKCSDWVPLSPEQGIRDLVFKSVLREEDEKKTRRLRKRVGKVDTQDTTTVSLRMIAPIEAGPWDLSHPSATPDGLWLLSGEELGRLTAQAPRIAMTSDSQDKEKAAIWQFELQVRTEQHGDLKFRGGASSFFVPVSAKKRAPVQLAWECAGAATLNDGSLGTLLADSDPLLAPQAVLRLAKGLATTCPDVSTDLTAASCPILDELAADFANRIQDSSETVRAELRGLAPILLKDCNEEQTLSLRQAMGSYLSGLLEGADGLEVEAQILAHRAARDFMTTWGSLLSEQTVLKPGLTALESLTALLHAQHDKLISAKQFGQARVVARSLKGYTAEWDTGTLTRLDTALEKHLAEQLPGKTTEDVNALFESLETALGSAEKVLLAPPYKRVVQTLTDAAMEAKDFEVLAQLSEIHAQQLGSEWAETQLQISVDLRLEKAKGELSTAIEELSLDEIQKIDGVNRAALEHRGWEEQVASSRKAVIRGLVSAASAVEDYLDLDTLIEIHSPEMDANWEQETREVSTTLRRAKAKADLNTALVASDLSALDSIRMEHGEALGEEWLSEVSGVLSQLIHDEFENRLAQGLVKYAGEWVETHTGRLEAKELEVLTVRMKALEAGDPRELIPGLQKEIKEAKNALLAAMGPDSPLAKALAELTGGQEDKGGFESDRDYLDRLAKLEGKMLGLRLKHLQEPLRWLSIARNRTVTTRNFKFKLEQSNYNANSEQWDFKVVHNDFERESLNVNMKMSSEAAQTLFENQDKINIIGTLALDPNGQPSLISAQLSEELSKASWSFWGQGKRVAGHVGPVEENWNTGSILKGRKQNFNELPNVIYDVLYPSLPQSIPVKYLLSYGPCGDKKAGIWLRDLKGDFRQEYSAAGAYSGFPGDCAAVVPGGQYAVVAKNTSERVKQPTNAYSRRVQYKTIYSAQLGLFSLTSGLKKRVANLNVITSNPWSEKYRRLTKIRSVTSLPDGKGIVVLGDWDHAGLIPTDDPNLMGQSYYYSVLEARILHSTSLRERRRINLNWLGRSLPKIVDTSLDSRYLIFYDKGAAEYKIYPTQGRRDGRAEGCYVTEVKRRSHASALGLRKGDILDPGNPCYNVASLVQRAQSGERLTLKFKRSGTTYKRTLKLKSSQHLGLRAEERRPAMDSWAHIVKIKGVTISPDNTTAEVTMEGNATPIARWIGLGDYAF